MKPVMGKEPDVVGGTVKRTAHWLVHEGIA